MRKSNFLVMMGVLACAVLVSSCSANDDTADHNDTGTVRFTAGIAQAAASQGTPMTKAAGTTWANGDVIGIFMVGHGTTSALEANKRYTTTGGSDFTAVSGDEIYYPMDGGKVDFIAYYPYKAGNTLGTAIDVEIATVQTAGNQSTFDMLWAKADNGTGYTKGDAVALTFDHKLAKLVMNCTADASVGITGFDGITVSINGMNTKNTLNLADGTLGIPGTAAAITPRKLTTTEQGFMASYDAVILPGTYAAGAVTVTFTLNGGTSDEETFTWTLTAPEADFAGGNEYVYEVTLTRTGVQVTGTINPWITGGPNDRGPVTAE